MRPPFLFGRRSRAGRTFRMKRTLAVLLFAARLHAADPPFHAERLLLPVLGGTGARFIAQLTIFNAGSQDVQYYPAGCFAGSDCFYEPALLQRDAVRKIGGIRPDQETQFFYVSAGAQLETALTARDWQNRLTTPGADIPVVRQKDLRTGRLSLVGVPHSVRATFDARATLRIYAPDALTPAAFTVRVLPESGSGLPVTPVAVVQVTTSVRIDDPNGVPLTPGIVRVDAFERFLPDWGLGDVRVEIEAADPVLPFWAMITITNNGNQSIRVIAPPGR